MVRGKTQPPPKIQQEVAKEKEPPMGLTGLLTLLAPPGSPQLPVPPKPSYQMELKDQE
jgi:hypothetical protein